MSADWSWLFLDAHGNPVEGEGVTTSGFPTQSDAESYLGESWRELLDAGSRRSPCARTRPSSTAR